MRISTATTIAVRRLAVSVVLMLTLTAPLFGQESSGRTINALDVVDPAKHAVGGQWRKSSEGLVTASATGSRITLPIEPQGEYDFTVSFTRRTGQHSVALFFTAGSGQASFEIDAWNQHLAGIQNIGGRSLRENSTRVDNQTLVNGRRYTAEVRVRRDRVEARLNGQLLTTYRGDGSNLQMLGTWRLPSRTTLGVGAWQAETVFHSIEVRSISGNMNVASAGTSSTSSNRTPVPPRRTTTPATNPSQPRRPASDNPRPSTGRAASGDRVLIVIANDGFFYREYGDPRAELERAGFTVEVAAARKAPCRPHANSGQGGSSGIVQPDFAIADVNPDRYRAILFSGGWGSSMYQYAFQGRYNTAAYNGDRRTKETANRLINTFVEQDKYVCALCHGVSVLAWSRVNGRSLLAGKRATGPTRSGPAGIYNGRQSQPPSRWNAEVNGAVMVAPNSVGNPRTAADDIVVDGKIITGQDDISAREMGRVMVQRLRAGS